MIFDNYFLNTFYTKTVFAFVGLRSGQPAAWFLKGIFSAGISNSYYDKRSFFTFADADLYKRTGNASCSFHCIVQQVTEQRSDICVCNKINDSASYIGMKSNMPVEALTPVSCQDSIQHFMVAQPRHFL